MSVRLGAGELDALYWNSDVTVGDIAQRVVQSRADLGYAIERCIDAMAESGTGWDEQSLVVATERSGDAVMAELAGYQPGTLGVESLRELGRSQTECLQTLYRLTAAGWHVVGADDCTVDHRPIRYDDFERVLDLDADDELDDPWYGGRTEVERFAARVIDATARFGRWW